MMKKPSPIVLSLLVTVLFLFFSNLAHSQLIINEVMPANGISCLDEDGESSDWIELKNIGNESVNLSDFLISDKRLFADAFRLPDTVIPPGGLFLMWASGKSNNKDVPLTLEARGGFFGMWSWSDTGSYFYDEPFDSVLEATFQVRSIVSDEKHSSIGIIVRDTTDANSRYAGVFVNEDCGNNVHLKPSTNPNVELSWFSSTYIPIEFKFPNCYLRVRYIKDTIYFEASSDSISWPSRSPLSFHMDKPLNVGIAFSPNTKSTAKAVISGISINGKKYPDGLPKHIDYGQESESNVYKHAEFHMPFQLSADKETVYLWKKAETGSSTTDGSITDSITWKDMKGDVSIGRNLSNEIALFDIATPNKENTTNSYKQQAAKPVLSNGTGYYTSAVSVTLNNSDSQKNVHYTLDGTEPTLQSLILNGSQLTIDTNTIVRAKYFPEDISIMPSDITSESYFFQEATNLATIAFVTDPKYLWSDSLGILYEVDATNRGNIWKSIENPANITLYRNNLTEFSQVMGISLRGGVGSREVPQKPFDLAAKARFGSSEIPCKVFTDKKFDKFRKFMLRNGGQDWGRIFMRDVLAAAVGKDVGIDYEAFFPCRVYLNGAYWGLYWAQEKSEEYFIAANYGYNPEDITILGAVCDPIEGSSKSYKQQFDALVSADLTKNSVFDQKTSFIDINNFIDYYCTEIIVGNTDWPGNNNKTWQNNKLNTKWRYILYDCDMAFGFGSGECYDNFADLLSPTMTTWANPPESTILFRKLITNENFKQKLFTRFADLLNTVCRPERTLAKVDSIEKLIKPEFPLQNARWLNVFYNWDAEMLYLQNYIKKRPDCIRNIAANLLSNSEKFSFNFISNIPKGCNLTVNTINNLEGDYSGIYFKAIPVNVTLQVKPGYKFVTWSGDDIPAGMNFSLYATKDSYTYTAIIQPDGSAQNGKIVINEIMYKPCSESDTKDWIEIYNNADNNADISSWTLKDDNDAHVFTIPENTYLAAHSFLVICEDTTAFASIHSTVANRIGNLGYGFGRGDQIRLFNNKSEIIDSVAFDVVSPWPTSPDGKCYTLELISPDYDNTLPQSWSGSTSKGGSPGQVNSTVNEVMETSPINISAYPNPSNGIVYVDFSGTDITLSSLKVINSLGEVVQQIVTNSIDQISGKLKIDLSFAPSGVYYLVTDYQKEFNPFRNISKIVINK